MNRFLSERLMTIEEAKALSGLSDERDARAEQRKRAAIWSWQSVDGVLSQSVADEQVERAVRQTRKVTITSN
jgi:hypothetical protein